MEQLVSDTPTTIVEDSPTQKPVDEIDELRKSINYLPGQVEKAVEEYAATDREMIIFFFVNDVGHMHKIKTPGYKTVFYFDKAQVEPLIKIWQSPLPIVVDIRKVFQAERIFNAAVHDDA